MFIFLYHQATTLHALILKQVCQTQVEVHTLCLLFEPVSIASRLTKHARYCLYRLSYVVLGTH